MLFELQYTYDLSFQVFFPFTSNLKIYHYSSGMGRLTFLQNKVKQKLRHRKRTLNVQNISKILGKKKQTTANSSSFVPVQQQTEL